MKYIGLIIFFLLNTFSLGATTAETALVVPSGQQIQGDLATVTQDITVGGVVTGDVTSWSGNIRISGRVDGDVVSYTGMVWLQPGAVVEGSVMALGSEVDVDTTAVVQGATVRGPGRDSAFHQLVTVFFMTPNAQRGGATIGSVLFGVTLSGVLLAFCLLVIGFWPRRSATTAAVLMRFPGRSILLGAVATIAVLLLLPVLSTLLAITLIGLPLVGVLFIAVNLPFIYGLAVLAQAGRTSIEQGMPGTELTAAAALVPAALILPLGLVTLLSPLAGLLLFYVLASPGLGAALLSRGGLFAPAAS